MFWWLIYLMVWLAATLSSWFLTAFFGRLGSRVGFIDRPLDERHKRHRRAVPSLGGPAMFLAWLLVLNGGLAGAFVMSKLPYSFELDRYLPGVWAMGGRLAVIVGGGAMMLLLGLIDDWRPLRPGFKLMAQVLICGLVATAGIRITLFIPWPLANWLLTILWMLLVVNAVNIFDNMDGMAGGTALTASLLFFLIAALQRQFFVALLSSALGGAALGFVFLNWPPARIFMGDSGSHFLGYSLAVIGSLITYYSPISGGTPVSVLIPGLILALPVFDLFAVVYLRLRQGQPVYQADNQHLSHRFRNLGLTPANTAWVVNLLGLAIGAGAIPLLWLPGRLAVVVFIQAGAMLALVSILHTVRPVKASAGNPVPPGGGKSNN